MSYVIETLSNLLHQTAFFNLTWGNYLMILVACVFLYLSLIHIFVRLPLLGGVVSPQFRLFPKYARGVFEEKGKFMAVSTGIGTHSMLPRLGNPTEVVVLDLF